MKWIVPAALASLALACSSEEGAIPDGLAEPTEDAGVAPVVPDVPATCTAAQLSYTGFGGTKLEAGRLEAPIGVDRERMKPYSMLVDEYKRVLSTTPTVLAESGPTFGLPPARWLTEPKAGAVSIYQAYRVAFEGCLEYTKTDAKYAAAPTDVTAAAECASMERKFWSRTPSPEEIQSCVTIAATDSATEAVPGGTTKATDPRRRWAYACATVLTAPGFLTY